MPCRHACTETNATSPLISGMGLCYNIAVFGGDVANSYGFTEDKIHGATYK